MEKAPDKIYVPIVNLGIEDGEHPAPLWWNKDKKSEHPDVVGTIAYIRKDALLEWARTLKESVENNEPFNDVKMGFTSGISVLIDKLNSL